jgi:hypothetical protein
MNTGTFFNKLVRKCRASGLDCVEESMGHFMVSHEYIAEKKG